MDPIISNRNAEQFVAYCRFWHGTHEGNQCEIYNFIKMLPENGPYTYAQIYPLIAMMDDIDPDWRYSFQTVASNRIN